VAQANITNNPQINASIILTIVSKYSQYKQVKGN
jgi:hypothetical protein